VPTNAATFTASFVPPTLMLSTAPGGLTLQWPAWAAPFSMWATTNLGSAVWIRINGTLVTNNGNLFLNLANPYGSSFYRLQFP